MTSEQWALLSLMAVNVLQAIVILAQFRALMELNKKVARMDRYLREELQRADFYQDLATREDD